MNSNRIWLTSSFVESVRGCHCKSWEQPGVKPHSQTLSETGGRVRYWHTQDAVVRRIQLVSVCDWSGVMNVCFRTGELGDSCRGSAGDLGMATGLLKSPGTERS